MPLGRLHAGLGLVALAKGKKAEHEFKGADHEFKGAEKEFEEALSRFNSGKSVAWLAEGQFNLGRFYDATHRTELACKWWSDALKNYSKIGMVLAHNKVGQMMTSCPAK